MVTTGKGLVMDMWKVCAIMGCIYILVVVNTTMWAEQKMEEIGYKNVRCVVHVASAHFVERN